MMLEWIKCGCISCVAGVLVLVQAGNSDVNMPTYDATADYPVKNDLDFINDGLDDIQLSIDKSYGSESGEYENFKRKTKQDKGSCLDWCAIATDNLSPRCPGYNWVE